MSITIGNRHKLYESAYDYKIIQRLPIIIRVDGRSFHSVTKKLEKPYCPKLMDIMAHTLIETIRQLDGAVFGYQQSDEITFVLKNDKTNETEPWFANRIQKIASVTAAITTYEFNKKFWGMNNRPDLHGQTIFDARVFAVPNISEAINNLIWRQQDCTKNAITNAAQHELGKLLGKKTTYKLLHNKNQKAREELLKEKCGIIFSEHYPDSYKFGIASYRVPLLLESNDGNIVRHKWVLDKNLPTFSMEREFIRGILESGKDIFRADRNWFTEGV